MKKVETTFKISKDVFKLLEGRVPKRKRNTFIEEAIRCRFAVMEQEAFMRELIMDNKARDEQMELIDAGLAVDDVDEMFQSKDDELLNADEIMEFDEFL
jgi:hypothetical protein